jgi:hypothetical protein
MPSGFAQVVSQFFVNPSPVAKREYPNEPGCAIDFIDEPKHKPVNSRRSGSPENGFELKVISGFP